MRKLYIIMGAAAALLTSCESSSSSASGKVALPDVDAQTSSSASGKVALPDVDAQTSSETEYASEERKQPKLLGTVTSADDYEVRFGFVKDSCPLGTKYEIWDNGVYVHVPERMISYYKKAVHVGKKYWNDYEYDSFDILVEEVIPAATYRYKSGKTAYTWFRSYRYDRVYPESWTDTITQQAADSQSVMTQVKALQEQYSPTADEPGLYCNVEFRMVIDQMEYDAYLADCAAGVYHAIAGMPTWIVSYGNSSVYTEIETHIQVVEITVE
jgi:hypothetical protein